MIRLVFIKGRFIFYYKSELQFNIFLVIKCSKLDFFHHYIYFSFKNILTLAYFTVIRADALI